MKIKIDRNLCIGAAPCVAVANKTFGLDEEGKAYLIDENGDPEEIIMQAAESCPVQAISLFDDDGNQIFPKVSTGKDEVSEEK